MVLLTTISKHITSYERRVETQSQNCVDQGPEVACSIHVNLQYIVKWRGAMGSPRPHSLSKTSGKAGKAWCHSDAATRPRVRANRQAELEGDDVILISDDATDYDILDLIADSHRGLAGIDGAETERNEMVADSDGDSCSSLDSLESGPSLLQQAPPPLCSGCQSLYEKATTMSKTVKGRDKDPSSLSCDQWVLRKKWRPRRLSNVKGRLWTHLRQIRKRAEGELSGGERKTTVCSRPHSFLQRSLRQAVDVGREKRRGKRRGKRLRGALLRGQASGGKAPGSGISKRRRLHSNSFHTNPGVSDESDQEDLQRACRWLSFQVSPTSVTLETPDEETEEDVPEQEVIAPEQEAERKRGGFRTMLAQVLGNRSAIVREMNI